MVLTIPMTLSNPRGGSGWPIRSRCEQGSEVGSVGVKQFGRPRRSGPAPPSRSPKRRASPCVSEFSPRAVTALASTP
ncbi:hypothetical protein SXIM_42360 [Streptomyces xiamenensis]|uniref:Uncharacterized protein n=1 Tax=Streptomyces xiamenensis TaxID=408015 RepID=A0A0F7FY20_9ACTN|nr:hypothetical protein SXIM_42360 [Streptomyces xiamenensis]